MSRVYHVYRIILCLLDYTVTRPNTHIEVYHVPKYIMCVGASCSISCESGLVEVCHVHHNISCTPEYIILIEVSCASAVYYRFQSV